MRIAELGEAIRAGGRLVIRAINNALTFPFTECRNFLLGTGEFPDANGWSVTGTTTQRTFVSGQGMRILDASTGGGSTCQFIKSVGPSSTLPFHFRTRVRVDAASSDTAAYIWLRAPSGQTILIYLRTNKVRWLALSTVEHTYTMNAGMVQLDVIRIRSSYWLLYIDGVLKSGGSGTGTGSSTVEFGSASAATTCDLTFESVCVDTDSARLPGPGTHITAFQSVAAGTQIAASGSSGTAHRSFPGADMAPNGDIVAAWRAGSTHTSLDGNVEIARSTDNGATWSSPSTLFTAGTDLRDVSITTISNNTMVMIFTDNASAGVWIPYLSTSTDDGNTWSTPAAIGHDFTDWGFCSAPIWEDDGSWYLPLYGEDTGDTYSSVRIYESTDLGATWTLSSVVWEGATETQHGQEPNLIKIGSEWICAVRLSTTASTRFFVASSPAGPWSVRSTLAGLGRPSMTYLHGFLWVMNRNGGGAIGCSPDVGVTWLAQMATNPVATGSAFNYGAIIPLATGNGLVVFSAEASASAASIESSLLNPGV